MKLWYRSGWRGFLVEGYRVAYLPYTSNGTLSYPGAVFGPTLYLPCTYPRVVVVKWEV
jgi:hypothetical protein